MCVYRVANLVCLFVVSAGGGGKSDHRQAKINAKNTKLNDERQRTVKQAHKEKDRKSRGENKQEAAAAPAAGGDENDDFAGIHPSRRMRMN